MCVNLNTIDRLTKKIIVTAMVQFDTEVLTVNRLFDIRNTSVGGPVILSDDSSNLGTINFTRAQIARAAHQVAGQLESLLQTRLSKSLAGASIAVVLPNGVEYVCTFLAIACAGGINCLLNPKYLEPEISFAVKDLSCDVIVISSAGCPEAEKAAEVCGKVPIVSIEWSLEANEPVPRLRFVDDAKMEQQTSEYKWPAVSGSTLALKLHTSGTTSKPKTVPITHSNIVATCLNQRNTFKWVAGKDRCLLIMPLFHVHGLFNGCIAPLAAGCYVGIPKTKAFSKSMFWGDVVKHQANIVTAVPSIWQILLSNTEDYPGEQVKLRYVRGCSSALAPATAAKLEAAFHTVVLESYAMSEATHQMCSNVEGSREFGTVGYPQGVEIAIIDPSTGKISDIDQPGEICVRGYNVITKYEGLSEEANAANFYKGENVSAGQSFASSLPALPESLSAIQDADSRFQKIVGAYTFDVLKNLNRDLSTSPVSERPFLRTGDLGQMDAQGRVTYIARLKELINRGGEKISPIEIDGVYLKNPQVKGAASFGYPDDILGETVAIVIVPATEPADPKAFAEEIQKHAASHLAKFKMPSKTFISQELPLGPTGKVLRRELLRFVSDRKLTQY